MTYLRKKLDISSYLVIGPENTAGRPVADVIRAALRAGFTCMQIRAKESSAREILTLCDEAAKVRAELGKADSVTLLVDDRLDVVLAAREQGIPVDGVHVGQKDIPPAVCRKYLGPDSVVGLSARAWELIDYVEHADVRDVDYFGAGPLHPTATKPDSGLKPDGTRVTRTLDELRHLHEVSPVPVVVGGGVKARDIPALKATGVNGFFVVSAVAGAENPYEAAKELTTLWNS